MANDFFGGILDSARGAVTDLSSFFDHSIGSAVARAVVGGSKPQNNTNKLFQANSLANLDDYGRQNGEVRYSPASDSKFGETKSVNFENIEMAWLQRMRRFSQIDAELNTGRVNEGKPQ